MIQLSTHRLRLRKFQYDDWKAIQQWSQDVEANLYDEGDPLAEAEAQDIVQSLLESSRATIRTDYYFMIHRREDDALVGSVYVAVRDETARKAEIGYRIDRQFWGKGYATEAAERVLEFGFDRLDMQRIFAHVLCENIGSVRVLEKIGMQQEGILRQDSYFHGRFWDVCMYGIVVSDWMRET